MKTQIPMDYEVIVGNVGTVYAGRSFVSAHKAYLDYVAISGSGHGRAAGESVVMMVDGWIKFEHTGTV